MDKFIIKGGTQLNGTIKIGGAKNAVLPVMAAALLTKGVCEIENVPNLRDVQTMAKLMRMLGAVIEFSDGKMTINTENITNYNAPYDLVKTMRASVYVLGPLLAKYGKTSVSLPGGCAWGPRPIDLHLKGLESLGAKVELDAGYINAEAEQLTGSVINFEKSSVGATGNILMAAVLAKGKTVIKNAAEEPEITFLAEVLVQMGAKITSNRKNELEIEGVEELKPFKSSVIPDRIEAGTFLTAAALTGGKITLTDTEPGHLGAVIDKLKEAGLKIDIDGKNITIESDGEVKSVSVTTEIYPGFPTDMQAQWIALMTTASGGCVVEDTVYFDRFTHVAELNRFGADIKLEENRAYITGVDELTGAPVMSTDLRASASLIIAGLKANDQTEVQRIYHIDRGYDNIEEKLTALGADITRVNLEK